MTEVKGVDAGLSLQARALEPAFDSAATTRLQLHVGQPFQRGRNGEILASRIRKSRLQLAAHRRQVQFE